jgi:O-antigen/teichoic acid export membrane protein
MTFYNRVDSVMLERMLDNGNRFAGIYAAAYRLLDAFNMIAYLFAVILLPLFSKMLKIKENILPIIRISFSMLFVFSTFITLFCAFNSQQLMSMMYHDLQTESAKVFSILIFCFIPVSATYIFGTLLTANGSLKKLNIIAFSGMLLNIGLNLFIIPKFLATGAASVSLATQSITAILQLIYVVVLFKIKPDYGFIFKLLLHLCLLVATLILLKNYTDNLLLIFSISAVTSFITASILKILQPIRFIRIMTGKISEIK